VCFPEKPGDRGETWKDPFVSGHCTVDGIDTSCGWAMEMLQGGAISSVSTCDFSGCGQIRQDPDTGQWEQIVGWQFRNVMNQQGDASPQLVPIWDDAPDPTVLAQGAGQDLPNNRSPRDGQCERGLCVWSYPPCQNIPCFKALPPIPTAYQCTFTPSDAVPELPGAAPEQPDAAPGPPPPTGTESGQSTVDALGVILGYVTDALRCWVYKATN
jgi:hypothetical protein